MNNCISDDFLHKRRVLVIDDDDSYRNMIIILLRQHGYDVIGIENATLAYNFIMNNNNDLALLLDQQLPEMTGLDLIRKLEQTNIKVPFIVMTGFRDDRLAVEMMKHGAADYLFKDSNLVDILPGIMERFFRNIENEIKLIIAQKALMESEERYRIIAENTADVISVFGLDFKVNYVSPSIFKFRGLTVEEAMSQSLDQILTPESLNLALKTLSEQIALEEVPGIDPKRTLVIELEYYHKDGHTFWAELSASFIRDADGKPKELLTVTRNISKRKETEAALLEKTAELELSRERLDLAMYASNSGLWDWDIRNNKVYFDPRYFTMAGYEPDEFAHSFEEWEKRVHPEDLPRCYEKIKDYLAGSLAEYDSDFRFLRKDGSWMWIRGHGKSVKRDEKGAVLRFVGTHTDITERKTAVNSLIQSEEKYRALVDNSFEGIAIISLEGNILFANKAIFGMLEIENESELLGRNVFEFLSVESMTKAIEDFQNVLQGIDSYVSEYSGLTSKGNLIYIESIGKLISYNGITADLLSLRDITRRRTAEISLRESEEKLRAIIDTANIGISIIDAEGNYVLFNKWWAEFLRYRNEELKQKTFLDITYHEDIDMSKRNFSRAFRGEISKYRFEKRYVRGDGAIVWGDLSVACIKDAEGNTASLVTMVIDVTEQKIADEKLRDYSLELEITNEELRKYKEVIEDNMERQTALIKQLETAKEKLETVIREKDKFFSIIAHDLKSPLGNFKQISKLLYDEFESFTEEDLKEFIKEIKESSKNVYELLENLLDWSRSQRGLIKYNPESVNLTLLFDNCRDTLIKAANQKDIEIVSTFPEDAFVQADPNLLTAILRNLISNAIKFTKQGGRVEIGIGAPKGNREAKFSKMLTIYVKDNGIGMRRDTLNKLFKIDQNVSMTGTSGERGTGLGLILCKEFAEKHGGKIWVESKLDKGSIFYFTLPRINKSEK